MVRARPTLPAGHGELLASPPVAEWPALMAANLASSAAWSFEVGGVAASDLRSHARTEALEAGLEFSRRFGLDVDPRTHGWAADAPVIMTGHQPELYHPGVWVKDFLLERIAEELSAVAVDLVVDTDGFDAVEILSPCLVPEMRQCRAYLAIGAQDATYVGTSVPTRDDVRAFCDAADANLATLPAPAIRRHFERFCTELDAATEEASNLAELVTVARRRYERDAGTDYLELPVSHFGSAFLRFVAHIVLDADRFATLYNEELAEYRTVHKTRSAAQPFPDLAIAQGRFELPFWVVRDGRRASLHVEPLGSQGARLYADADPIADVPAGAAAALDVLRGEGMPLLAPKAVPLTMFARLFLSDLFIHGVGGGRYDRVTDDLIRRYFGVEPPAFVVASLTMYLPLGAHLVTDDEVSAAKERLNRLSHNPDALLAEVDFDDAAEHHEALRLAAEKNRLVADIAHPGADKKALGARIRETNSALATLLEPLRAQFEADVASLEAQRAASEVLTDRGYPFCFWSPEEIADKVR